MACGIDVIVLGIDVIERDIDVSIQDIDVIVVFSMSKIDVIKCHIDALAEIDVMNYTSMSRFETSMFNN